LGATRERQQPEHKENGRTTQTMRPTGMRSFQSALSLGLSG
jgi:hypothetical protein